jgi:hypothetical protein
MPDKAPIDLNAEEADYEDISDWSRLLRKSFCWT